MRKTSSILRLIRLLNGQAARHALASVMLFSATAFTCISASAQILSTQIVSAPMLSSPAVPPSLSATLLSNDHASLSLPDAPGYSTGDFSGPEDDSEALPAASSSPSGQASPSLPEASRTQRHPLPGQPVPVLTTGDKVRIGFQGAFSFYTILGWVASAGYEHGVNSSPNWGTDRGAFGQRLWCSAARATSENLLSDAVFAPLFHEDPRYYRLGRTHKFIPRLGYSVSRAFITRSDSGGAVPNFSQILGNAAGSALTYAYYPEVNRTAKDTAETFAGSMGGTALGNVIAEFAGRFIFSRHRD